MPRLLTPALAALLLAFAPGARAADDPAAAALEAAKRADAVEAIRLSDEAVRAKPSAATWNVRGYVLSSAGKKDEALDAYARASALDPKDLLSRLNRGSILLSLARNDEAKAVLDEAIAIDPRSARAHNHRAVALERLGRLEDARNEYRAAIGLDPKDAVAQNNLGALAHRRGVEGAAATLFARAAELDPALSAARLNRALASAFASPAASAKADAEVLAEASASGAPASIRARAKGVEAARASADGRLEDAKRLHLEQLTLDGDDPSALNNLGVVEDRLGETREALTHFQAALDLRPDDSTVRNNIGVVQVHRGDLAAAETEFRAVLRTDPRFHRAHHNLGVVLGARGDRAGAIASLRRAADLQPDDASALYNVAILAREFGADRASERAAYERALRLDPALDEARLALGTLLADPATPASLRDEARARDELTRFLAKATAGDVAGRRQATDWLVWLDASAAFHARTAPR